MRAIIDKQEVLSDDNEETNNVQLEDLNVIPLEEIKRKLDKNMVKWLLKMRPIWLTMLFLNLKN